ncbi:hypothetical protein OEZ82_26410, partial [Leclercia adecarboxylata]|uniref:type VI secretion system-associated FHA domain protein n=1 Tax=Leclercia adecarboxylata TaxID=83655 RepID=UPI00234C5087
VYAEVDDFDLALAAPQRQAQQRDYARIDMESLPLPELVMPQAAPEAKREAEPERLPQGFWARFGEALGIDLDDLDEEQRQALALNAARLLKQSIGGLQQSLRTRSELKNELRLSLTTVQSSGNNPLKHSADTGEAVSALLRGEKPGQLTA